MAAFAFSVLWILAFSALQVISLSWGEIKRLKETVSTVKAVLLGSEKWQTNGEALGIWLKRLEDALLDASDLLYEIERWSHGSAGQKLCRFFSSSNPLVFRFRIRHRIKKTRERIDKILAEGESVNFIAKCCSEDTDGESNGVYFYRDCEDMTDGTEETYSIGDPETKKIREVPREISPEIEKLNLNRTYFLIRASKAVGLDDDRAKQIVYIVACIVGVCVDPFFLYIPFISRTEMCLGMNRELWKVAVALRTVADFFTALILFMSIYRPQLRRCTSSIKLFLLMCVKYVILAPIPQILFSGKFILKTLGGYTFWNLILFSYYGTRLVLIFQVCEQLKRRVSVRTLVRFNTPVYLFLYFIVSHVIGGSWYYLSIKRRLSCWNHACKINTGCIFPCDGTTPSTLNSTLVNEFCPLNPEKFGVYLDALQSGIVEDKGVLKKFLHCFFWGLQNLSSFASNLYTSTNDGETFFAIIISALALILFLYIIRNIQRYSELDGARSKRIVDKMESRKVLIECLVVFHNLDNRTKKSIVEHIQEAFENGYESFNLESLRINHFLNDVTKAESVLEDLRLLEEWVFNGQPDNLGKAKKWLSDNNIPRDQNNILFYLTCRLKDDEDVNLTSVLSVLPDESKWMTMKDLCFDTLKKVPGLQKIDEEWFKRISTKLKPVIYPKESYIIRVGEPLDFIIFITNGIATSTDAFGSIDTLKKGDFFGEELVQWKLDKRKEMKSDRVPLSCIPISTADVKSHTQVEALVLMINNVALCDYSPDFPDPTSKLRTIIRKVMILNEFIRKVRNGTEGVDRGSLTREYGFAQWEIDVQLE